MNKRALRADILLLLTAGIWGFGFVAQRSGMEYLGPFAYNGIRFILGSLSLLPLFLIRQKAAADTGMSQLRRFCLYSLAAGGCLFVAVILQQFGIMFTTAGNAGFITGLYVVLTPIFGIFLGKKTGPATWFGSVLTLAGLYFLSAAGRLDSVNPGDIITVASAVFWAFHVLLIDRLVRLIDPILLSMGQFAVCGILSLGGAFLLEPFVAGAAARINPILLQTGLFAWLPFPALTAELAAGAIRFPAEAAVPILYGGLASVGIAYTLQVVAQHDAPPAHATIILCLEGCFAALGGALLLSEKIGPWTLLGFILMLAGMLITQWEVIGQVKTIRRRPAEERPYPVQKGFRRRGGDGRGERFH
ncbi:MAG: DMT family transporter [Treponema sp.]|jgi:drug/metabolite transporter (DMT)-like permease|nr:DMT family transporter [Treponema sp.]